MYYHFQTSKCADRKIQLALGGISILLIWSVSQSVKVCHLSVTFALWFTLVSACFALKSN